jgi:hypothetical protein
MRKIRGEWYMMMQLCEQRRQQLIEAHVRCYCIRADTLSPNEIGAFSGSRLTPQQYVTAYPMRLQQPDDEMGGMVLMALPSLIVHRLDAWSPLSPSSAYIASLQAPPSSSSSPSPSPSAPSHQTPAEGSVTILSGTGTPDTDSASTATLPPHNPSASYRFPDTFERECDLENGGRELFEPAATSEEEKEKEEEDGAGQEGDALLPPSTSPHTSSSSPHTSSSGHEDRGGARERGDGGAGEEWRGAEAAAGRGSRANRGAGAGSLTQQELETYFRDRRLEVVVVLEGNDEQTSQGIQARYS